jgi:LuxR family transcriptional regulator of csgAB operon
MTSRDLVQKNKQTGNSISEEQVYIVGQLRLQNDLLAAYIEEKAGMKCVCWPVSEISPFPQIKSGQKSLILWDCLNSDMDHFWSCLYAGSGSNMGECFVALFNVPPGLGIENRAIKSNVRGIFYENDPPEILTRGVQAVLNGELWFSRRMLTKHILDKKDSDVPIRKASTSLTPREKEILGMIASGAPNDEIVKELCISLHTVKTHIYNIYKKVKVSNRTQAALWATRHI